MRCFLKTECRKPCAAHSIGPDHGCCSGFITKKQTFRVDAKCIHVCFCLNVLHSLIQVDRTGVSLALLTQKVLHTITCTCKGHRCSQSISKCNAFLLITLVVGNNIHIIPVHQIFSTRHKAYYHRVNVLPAWPH